MRLDGSQLAFLDIDPGLTKEYNRWYDLDHIAEHISKPDVLFGRRYVAPAALQGIPGSLVGDALGGHTPYLTWYGFGGPLDMASDEAKAGWTTMDKGIVRQGRYWQPGKVLGWAAGYTGTCRARPGCLVSEPAIPYLAHRGVIVAKGRAKSVEGRADAVAWWNDVHLVDLFTVPGVLASIRLDPVLAAGAEPTDEIVHILLCEDALVDVMPRLDAMLRYTTAVGRWPAHKGVYTAECLLPYDRIVPLDYDFDFGS